ncbi:GntR family transcriptional regulator [Micromonospora craniellae]|uniref:GntR family transcriptional regulator n=1 Tax=Micromonospora craniellae TaxID=2294034 RepID=A0A372G6L5_9ACTN|nr:GntR family transcriptional regulator [Micromonospora craniellae]RFS48409.1 GntR family transcriptional regulator [Micromonospora craniellae]
MSGRSSPPHPHPRHDLPSTSQVADMYDVRVNTAYRAMSLLHDRDLIIGRPGRGTFVADRPERPVQPSRDHGVVVATKRKYIRDSTATTP